MDNFHPITIMRSIEKLETDQCLLQCDKDNNSLLNLSHCIISPKDDVIDDEHYRIMYNDESTLQHDVQYCCLQYIESMCNMVNYYFYNHDTDKAIEIMDQTLDMVHHLHSVYLKMNNCCLGVPLPIVENSLSWLAQLNIVKANILYWAKDYKQSYEICKNQLDNDALIEDQRQIAEDIKDKNIDHFKDQLLQYPFINQNLYNGNVMKQVSEKNPSLQDIKSLPIHDSMFPDIIPSTLKYNNDNCFGDDDRDGTNIKIVFSITTCKRYDLFEKTINSFLHCCLDLDKIDYWLCVDDNSCESDRLKMKENYPWFNFIWKNENEKGHYKSMNIIHEFVTALLPNVKYLLHMEDDFHFINRQSYVQQGKTILKEDKLHYGQVLFNRNYAEIEPYKQRIAGGILKKTKSCNIRYVQHEYYEPNSDDYNRFVHKHAYCGTNAYWKHFSFRPSLMRCSMLKDVGKFCNAVHFEQQYSHEYYKKEYKSVFFDTFSCIHIGKKTWEANGVNSYTLNNMDQFGTHTSAMDGSLLSADQLNVYLLYDSTEKTIQNECWKQFKAKQAEKLPVKFHCIDMGEKVKEIDNDLRPLFIGNQYQYRRDVLSPIHRHAQIWRDGINIDYTLVLNTCCDKLCLPLDFWQQLEQSLFSNEIFIEKQPDIVFIDKLESDKVHSSPLCGCDYIVTKNGCERLLQLTKQQGIKNSIESFFMELIQKRYDIKVFHLPLIYKSEKKLINTYNNDCTENPLELGYTFYSQMDSIGGDLDYAGVLSLQELKERCDENPDCIAFNTLGWLKKTITPEKEWKYLPHSNDCKQGLFVKKQ